MKRVLYHLLITTGVLIAVIVCCNNVTNAQWSHDSNVNNPICTDTLGQFGVNIASDGAGGSIICWQDSRNTTGESWNIYAQRIDSTGHTLWAVNGVPICTAAYKQTKEVITSDGAGGAIIVWADFRSNTNWDIYAQRVNAFGVVQWQTDGVPVNTDVKDQEEPRIVSDGAGGVIITYDYLYSVSDVDVYAARITNSGVVQWVRAISNPVNTQVNPSIGSDGTGGAIISWNDLRNTSDYDIYAQRINPSGSVLWATNGIPISVATGDQINSRVINDGATGAYIAWDDQRNGSPQSDIYIQHIDSYGNHSLANNGLGVCVATGPQYDIWMVSDAQGGVILGWWDNRNSSLDIYAQRVGVTGELYWTSDGIAICTVLKSQYLEGMVADGFGGAILTWADARTGNNDVYVQDVSSSGSVGWETNGMGISTAPGYQSPGGIVSDGKGGAIIAFQDERNSIAFPDNDDVYAQNIDRNGYLAFPNPVITSVKDVALDQGGKVTVSWDHSYLDDFPNSNVTYYSVWRAIPSAALISKTKFITPDQMTKDFSGQAYRIVQSTSGSTNWEWVGNVTSHYFSSYSYTVPTLSDSSANGNPYFKFLVSAQTSNQFVFWDSNVDSGYSVDNLSPHSAQSLSAFSQAGPSVLLHWNTNTSDPDVGYYEVHRSITSGFIPDASTKIGQASDTMFTDNTPVNTGASYYRIVTLDIHGNKSVPSAQASPASTMQYSVNDSWNMISVPLTVNNYTRETLYPTATTNAFAYHNGYVASQTLANGSGYWLKFNGSQQVSLTGSSRTTDTIPVQKGWNMVGSISTSVPVNQITSMPGGIVTSQFFGYNSGYSSTSSIVPGKGYWVKVNQAGTLILSSVVSKQSSAPEAHQPLDDVNCIKIVMTDELPPPPPDTQNSNPTSQIPNQFALDQNYPNPFNPTTTLSFVIGHESFVTLKVYNTLGEVVATLVNEFQDAGFKSLVFDASLLPSGVYTYRLTADNFSESKKFLLIK